MKTDHTLTAARLRELMRYEDGQLFWREHDGRRTTGPVGSPAGRMGRLQVHVGGVARYVHRLVWLYHHDEWPTAQIDHVDGDKHNNRIENLRVLINRDNAHNVDRGGVSFDPRKASRSWRARITVDGRTISLGYWDTYELAHDEYLRAKRIYHPAWVTGVGSAA